MARTRTLHVILSMFDDEVKDSYPYVDSAKAHETFNMLCKESGATDEDLKGYGTEQTPLWVEDTKERPHAVQWLRMEYPATVMKIPHDDVWPRGIQGDEAWTGECLSKTYWFFRKGTAIFEFLNEPTAAQKDDPEFHSEKEFTLMELHEYTDLTLPDGEAMNVRTIKA